MLKYVTPILVTKHGFLLGPGSHPAATHRPWSLPHPWAHGSFVTNRPEITAETVKPTATVPGTENSRSILSNTHHHHPNQPFAPARDHLFLSRLRNRYRQVKDGLWVCMRSHVFYVVCFCIYKISVPICKIMDIQHLSSSVFAHLYLLSSLRKIQWLYDWVFSIISPSKNIKKVC